MKTLADVEINEGSLRAWPLPKPSNDGDKEERGRALIIGGCPELAGAIVLAGNAAFRAGVGKVTIATTASIAPLVAMAIPEARVIGLREGSEGCIDSQHAVVQLASSIECSDAVLIGPGMQNEASSCDLVLALLPLLKHTKLVLDAYAMSIVLGRSVDVTSDPSQQHFLGRYDLPVLLTPHAGEMAHLTGQSKESVNAAPRQTALDVAKKWNAMVAFKGATTFIATPDHKLYWHQGGNIGLAASGSGDTLAGIIIGLAARGANLEQACSWGVALHARAGDKLAQSVGPLGYLARELADQIPVLMHELEG